MSNSNAPARKNLEVLYGCRDMLTGIKGQMTFHHLFKKADGGRSTIKNGALLIKQTHAWLTNMEYEDIELYNLVNECLDLYKQCIDYGNIDLIKQYENEVMPKASHLIFKR